MTAAEYVKEVLVLELEHHLAEKDKVSGWTGLIIAHLGPVSCVSERRIVAFIIKGHLQLSDSHFVLSMIVKLHFS